MITSDAALTASAYGTVKWAPVNLPATVATMEFFLSIDGVAWTSLGMGVNVSGEWLRTGLDLPAAGYLRVLARGTASASGASLLLESLATFTRPALPGLGVGSDPAIVANSYNRVQWLPVPLPSGVTQVVFYLSKDGGQTWTWLGLGSPISGGWERTGLILPLNAHIRVVATLSGTTLLTDTVAAFTRPIAAGVVENDPVLANINGVTSIAQIPDGRFMVARDLPDGRSFIGRVNSNGSVPYSSPGAPTDAPITTIAVKDDGKVVFGGEFLTVNYTLPRRSYTVLKSNGLVDEVAPHTTGALPLPAEPDVSGTDGYIYGSAVQPDGKTILVGRFITMGFSFADVNVHGGHLTYHQSVGRLQADQIIDSSFNAPPSSGTVYAVALQQDGKVLLGGDFTTSHPLARSHFYRANSDGTMDTGFTPDFDGAITNLVVQKDGKILVTGDFTMVTPQGSSTPISCGQIIRLNADGTLDTGFTPPTAGFIRAVALQADGKILVGGGTNFHDSYGTYGSLVRLNTNGTLDSSFEINQVTSISNILIQKNGRILIGPALQRLENTDATESFDVVETSGVYRLEWLRGGTSPEIANVTFDISTNGGTTWTPLGSGTSISGGWELDGLSSLPEPSLIRARGRPVTNSTSNSLLESVFTY
ncbi:MAG TPA: hypothetical protein DCP71_07340 [Verrucomicrobiales bacterium]|nr:hypothetical protein [Verrucomicrobiales bacterium]